MLLRVGVLSIITGAVFIAMAWLDPMGPIAIIFGSGCCAVALEAGLDAAEEAVTAVDERLPRHNAAA